MERIERMKAVSYVLILLGILVAAAPKLTEWRADAKQSRLLEQAERAIQQGDANADAGVIADYERVSRLLEEEDAAAEEAVSLERLSANGASPTATADEAKTHEDAVRDDEALATIEIASIDVKLPILEGATQTNMKFAAAHLSETAALGQTGNAAIAAHRARTKGRLFNRLDEVKAGDEIVVRQAGAAYVYTVFRTAIVEPTDVSVLNADGNRKWLTLITCDPVVNATHRLIVQAEME